LDAAAQEMAGEPEEQVNPRTHFSQLNSVPYAFIVIGRRLIRPAPNLIRTGSPDAVAQEMAVEPEEQVRLGLECEPLGPPLSSEHGKYKAVKARFWHGLSGESP